MSEYTLKRQSPWTVDGRVISGRHRYAGRCGCGDVHWENEAAAGVRGGRKQRANRPVWQEGYPQWDRHPSLPGLVPPDQVPRSRRLGSADAGRWARDPVPTTLRLLHHRSPGAPRSLAITTFACLVDPSSLIPSCHSSPLFANTPKSHSTSLISVQIVWPPSSPITVHPNTRPPRPANTSTF